jgi:hypothetical protein
MKRATVLMLALLVFACGEKAAPKPLSEPGEKLYDIRGEILGRRDSDNTVHIDHESIPGFMEAMAMDYQVRGAEVASLPPDKTRIEAKLHVTSRAYWITDVKRIP